MSNCIPTSSNCIIWDGPNIECLNLCTNDNITSVVYELATQYCALAEQLNLENLDFSCIDNTGDDPTDINELLQLVITILCELQNTIPVPGPTGSSGDIGATGATGATGPAGADGIDGAMGIQGNDGATGATGATGSPGPIGPQGPRGITGADGADGEQGEQGIPGECDCCNTLVNHIAPDAVAPAGCDAGYSASVEGVTHPLISQWTIISSEPHNITLVPQTSELNIGVIDTYPKTAMALLQYKVIDANGCKATETFLHFKLQSLIP